MGADVKVVLEEDEILKVTEVPSREEMGLQEIRQRLIKDFFFTSFRLLMVWPRRVIKIRINIHN